MSAKSIADAAKVVVRRNTEEVQSKENFEVFEELLAVMRVQNGKSADPWGVGNLLSPCGRLVDGLWPPGV